MKKVFISLFLCASIFSFPTAHAFNPLKFFDDIIKQFTNSSDDIGKSSLKDDTASPGVIPRRRITNNEKYLLNSGYTRVSNGKKVCQRDQTFDKNFYDAKGRTNCDRMASGIAPIGIDGKSVELHHLKQQNNGTIIEVTNTEHLENTQIWHRYTDMSEIDRKEFDTWRPKYWKERASHLCQ